MSNSLSQTPGNSLSRQDKDTKSGTELQIIDQFLREKTASRNMVEAATGIRIQTVCWRVGDLRKYHFISVVRTGPCPITGRRVEFLTTDPAKAPDHPHQLKLFTS